MKKKLIPFFALAIITACRPGDLIVQGMKPVYAENLDLHDIRNLVPQPMENTGKILLWNQYLLVGELLEGIHVIDQSQDTVPFTFIQIPYNKDFTIADSLLYADNGNDLVVIDISNISNVSVVSRLPDQFDNNMRFPPGYNGWFECIDPARGYVTGWTDAQLVNPKCRR
jgi:hypothetical protein